MLMKILFAAFKSADDFLGRLEVSRDAGNGLITVPTRARYRMGEPVILEIGFPGMPNRVLLRANARDPQHGLRFAAPPAGQSPAGPPGAETKEDALFEVAPGEEHKRDFLVAVAAGRANASWQRKHRRFPVRLPARFVADGENVPLRGDAETEDLGSGGLFLKTTRSLPEGTRVSVVLDPCDGSAEMEFSGRVVYTRGEDGNTGIGVQFDRLTTDDNKRLRRLIRDVKLRGKVVEWEDASGSF
jgi:Tfp pilus assembly protein PilZ